jgi:hypothetical protein
VARCGGVLVSGSRFLALQELWWVQWRDVEPVRSALLAAHALHFDQVLTRQLRKNQKRKRLPDSYIGLAHLLGRDVASLFRWREGQSEMTRMDVDAVADSLDIRAGILFPSPITKIALAASYLGGYSLEGYPGIAVEPRAYAAYRLAAPAVQNGDLDKASLGRVLGSLSINQGPVEEWIWDVVHKLEKNLEQASFSNPRYR